MSWITDLSPSHIQKLVPYASAGRDQQTGEIWLNANENPSARSLEGLPSNFNRYPDFQSERLLEAYAAYAGCTSEQLMVSRGIDEGIDLLLRAFCTPDKDSIAYTPPTYGMYSISAEMQGIRTVPVPLTNDFQLDIDQFMPNSLDPSSRAESRDRVLDRTKSLDSVQGDNTLKLIFLCSPNNPTGNLLKREDVLQVLELTRRKSLVVLDEAYIEFSPESSFIQEIGNYDNLIVARTLSKGFGLAGLRCGFLAADPEIIQILRKVSAPYPIPVPVVDIATAALTQEGTKNMQEDVESLTEYRQRLETTISQFDYVETVFPSEANFILFRVRDAQNLLDYLGSKGIIIRDQSRQLLLENCVRITIGSPDELSTLIDVMKEYGERS